MAHTFCGNDMGKLDEQHSYCVVCPVIIQQLCRLPVTHEKHNPQPDLKAFLTYQEL